jgi:hypothetical protein
MTRQFIGIALATFVLPAYGWGPEGHSLVARIAEAQLTPAARAQVIAILGPDRTLVSIASWADEIRRGRPETGPWHYIDIPIHQPHLDMARDCPKGDCVIAQITEFEKVLQDPAADPVKRREALMFVVHFVGDMHQPLHCSNNDDRGGNSVRVQFFDRTTNLHSVWDSGLLSRMPPEDQLLAVYSRESMRKAKKWAKGTPEQWAEQVHKSAQKITYGKLAKVPAGSPVPLDASYEKVSDKLIREELEMAGARLAFVLNTSLR